MSHPVARLGDTSDHGGSITSGSPNHKVDGIPIARVGDTFDCPLHGINAIITGSVNNKDSGKPIAHVGSKTQCGATITTGYAGFNVGG